MVNQNNVVGYLNLCANRNGVAKMVTYMRDISGRFYEISLDAYGLIKNATDAKTFIPDIDIFNNDLAGEDYTVIADRKALRPLFFEPPDSDAEILEEDD